ncbi:hypothetical protein F5J12DRAFT_414151 [Pisolithus orientalis]|uniref:uncharacterized protein n=1 Tax=Pisolithus orientalis TaxID=936130 RepID=UPI0022244B4D|nr:uncharacterized protein F5J12DRAFT_414151 [Pisolithus orientalis]KAI5994592.1 hypothetical protein F5J12DRAFT_414151 [Pisolithus orientalis]
MANFQWDNREQFISLIHLLSLRNGGQFEPNEDEADERVEIDIDIHWNKHSVGDSKEDKLKQHFLDRFAEMMSRKKGGKHVCCAAFRESGDRCLDKDVKISLLVARNTNFGDLDRAFRSRLEGLLATIGASVHGEQYDTSAVKEELWEELLCYNQPRLNFYAARLRDNLNAFKNAGSLASIPPYRIGSTTFCDNPGIGGYSADTHAVYMRLAQERILELDNILCSSDGAAQRRLLAEHTYSIRRMASLRILINSCPKASVGHKLLRDICFLGRLKSCLFTLVKGALCIPGFAQLSIILVENLQPRSLSCKLPPLVDAMRHLGQTLSTLSVGKYISRKLNVTKAERRFTQLQSKVSRKPLPTHADLQLILYITKTAYGESMYKEIYPYIGCSKLSCFLCAAFIKYFSLGGVTFRTRGSHGKIYPRWCIPKMDGLHGDMVMALNSALERMQHLLHGEFMKPIITVAYLPESSAGVTDDADDADDTDDIDVE